MMQGENRFTEHKKSDVDGPKYAVSTETFFCCVLYGSGHISDFSFIIVKKAKDFITGSYRISELCIQK